MSEVDFNRQVDWIVEGAENKMNLLNIQISLIADSAGPGRSEFVFGFQFALR
jgi:hypothetical protein